MSLHFRTHTSMSSRFLSAGALLTSVMLTGVAIAQTSTTPNNNMPSNNIPSRIMPPERASEMFYKGNFQPNHWRASEAVGQAVYNKANERIGEVDDLLVDGNGTVLAAIVGVGGFIGVGERKVAISYRSFEMSRDAQGNARLMVDVNKETLNNAEEYKTTNAMKR
jgi:hypothetical protein